jgi:hypothetical protein
MTDIKRGDLVVCIDAKPDLVDPLAHLLIEGRHYRVACVGPRTNDGIYALTAHDWPSNTPGKGWAFAIRRFRKIDKADEKFTEQVRACRPIKQREPA